MAYPDDLNVMPPTAPLTPNPIGRALATRQAVEQAAQQDPRIRQQALLALGLGLMRSRQPGTSIADQLATSVGGAYDVHQAGRRQAEQGLMQAMALGQQEREFGLKEQEFAERKATGEVGRKKTEQDIEQDKLLFPERQREIKAKIDQAVAAGKLSAAYAKLYEEQAKKYPDAVRADLLRAEAAGWQGKMFEATAASIARKEGITVDEARARLGSQYFGRANQASAGVQTLEAIEARLRKAKPKRPEEDNTAFEQRIAAESLKEFRTEKKKEYFKGKLEFIYKSSLNAEEASEIYDKMWVEMGEELPRAQAAPGAGTPGDVPSEVARFFAQNPGQSALRHDATGVTYVRGPNGKVIKRPPQSKPAPSAPSEEPEGATDFLNQ